MGEHERVILNVHTPSFSPNGGTQDFVPLSKQIDTVQQDICVQFMQNFGLDPTPDAIDQLRNVFVPCLRIMCERGYNPEGATWREGGWRSQLVDIRKKFTRLWQHGWLEGKFVLDHPLDLINYTAFYARIAMSGKPWGEWGEPEYATEEDR